MTHSFAKSNLYEAKWPSAVASRCGQVANALLNTDPTDDVPHTYIYIFLCIGIRLRTSRANFVPNIKRNNNVYYTYNVSNSCRGKIWMKRLSINSFCRQKLSNWPPPLAAGRINSALSIHFRCISTKTLACDKRG